MDSSSIACVDLEVAFGKVVALSRTSLHVAAGESVAIMGPSGSGKTTLLRVVQGLVLPTSGSARVLGLDQGLARSRARAELRRRKMGLISQNPDLLPEFSAVENVALPLLFDGFRRPEALGTARRVMDQMGIGDRCDADVSSLSGGEAQRVAVARALARDGVELIIADEPTASLDVDNSQTVTRDLLTHAGDRGATLVLATHDPNVAAQCDRTVRISRRIEAR